VLQQTGGYAGWVEEALALGGVIMSR
jgi:hypothetical protein